jgi:adenosine deaminase
VVPEAGSSGPTEAADRTREPLDLRTTSKVELHRHLEGSLRLSTILELSMEAGLSLPAETLDELAPYALATAPVAGLDEALMKFDIAQNAVRTYEAVRRVTREAVEDLHADGVRLAELRFSPEFLCSPGGLDWDEAMVAILSGIDDTRGLDVAVGLIVIFSRNYGMESGRRTVEFTLRHLGDVVAFDIAGPELDFPPHLYVDLVRPIKDAGIGLTTHYGESGPPPYPREAIELLGPTRLGHGLSVAWDEEVADLAAERGVTLEMCPTSNWLTQGVKSLHRHPIRRLLRRGVRVTLNSDDPGLFGIDLTHEWAVARDQLGFTDDDFRAVTTNSLRASFLPDDVKRDVLARHFSWADRLSPG